MPRSTEPEVKTTVPGDDVLANPPLGASSGDSASTDPVDKANAISTAKSSIESVTNSFLEALKDRTGPSVTDDEQTFHNWETHQTLLHLDSGK